MRSAFLRALAATTALVSAMAGGAAFADCQPDPAASGQTVTCSGTDSDGFDAGTATNLTFNVQAGATVTTAAAAPTVTLTAANTVVNAGTITQPGVIPALLLTGPGNIVTNLGTIAAPNDVAFAAISDFNTLINRGTITGVVGIEVVGTANTFTNYGQLSGAIAILAAGQGNVVINNGTAALIFPGVVIEAAGVANAVTNTGTVAGNFDGAIGILLVGLSNTVTNTGTVTVNGTSTFAIEVAGLGNAVNNSGTIAAGGAIFANGIFLAGTANTATNTGTITTSGGPAGGLPSFAIGLDGDGNTAANFGTIAATGPGSAGIFIFGGSTNTTVTNLGTIRATGAGAMAIDFEAGATTNAVTNAAGGLIYADANVNAVAAGFIAGGATGVLTNFGTIDGRLATDTPGLLVVNAGLIQITTGAVGQTHTVADYTQTAGGTLALRVNGVGTHDTLATSGTAALGGTLRAAVQPALYNNVTLYPNVVTNPVALGSTFASTVSTSPFFTASAAYGPGAVHLILTRIAFGAVPGLTQNQRAIGNALEAAYSPGASGAAATIFGTLLGGTTVPYDGLSGEVGTGVQNPSFAMGDAFLSAIFGQAQRWRGGMTGAPGTQSASMRVQFAAAQPTFELSRSYAQATAPGAEPWPPRSVGPHWSAWASGFGLSGNRDGDGTVGSARLGYSMGGGAFGADVQVNPNLLLGGAIGGAGSDFSLDGRSAGGTSRAMFFSLYGSWTMGPLYVDAAATYGLASFSTNRIATQGTFLERATGDFDGHQVGGRVEAGWRFMMQRYELTPFAGVTVQSLHQDGYSENATNFTSGAPGILGLSYQDQTTTSVRSTLGAQAATTFQLGERTSITPRIRAAWAHEFNDDRQVGASFLSIPAASFTVNGARPARDAALVSAGIDVGIGRNVTLFAQFDSELAGSGNAYAGSGGLRVSW